MVSVCGQSGWPQVDHLSLLGVTSRVCNSWKYKQLEQWLLFKWAVTAVCRCTIAGKQHMHKQPSASASFCTCLWQKACPLWPSLVTSRHTRKQEAVTQCWLMLGQRRRRWTNVKSTLGQRLAFAGIAHSTHLSRPSLMASNTHLWHGQLQLLRQCKTVIGLALLYYWTLNYHSKLQTVYVGVCAHGDIQNYADSAKQLSKKSQTTVTRGHLHSGNTLTKMPFLFFHDSFINLMCGEGVYMVVVDV